MSLKAGEAYIDISARVDKLDQGLERAKSVAVAKGGEVGKSFGYSFGDKFAEQSKGIMGQLAGPMIAATLAKSAATVLRSDKELPDAILDGMKSIPFVGAFTELGHAIYDSIFNAGARAAEEAAKVASAARDMILKAKGEALKEERADVAAAQALSFEEKRLELATKYAAIKRDDSSEKGQAIIDRELKLEQLKVEFAEKSLKEMGEKERAAMQSLFDERKAAIQSEHLDRVAAIDKAKAKEKQAADKQAEDEAKANAKRVESAEDAVARAKIERDFIQQTSSLDAQADEKQIRALEAARDRQLRDMERERALKEATTQDEMDAVNRRFDLEQQTADLKTAAANAQVKATADVASASTALGSFRFETYPAARQKDVQERTMRATEQTAEAVKGLATSTGFS